MNVYSIDFPIHATAYIKANSEAEAIEIAKSKLAGLLVNETDHESEVEFSGLPFDDPDLPNISISPVMTTAHAEEFDDAYVECVEHGVPDTEAA